MPPAVEILSEPIYNLTQTLKATKLSGTQPKLQRQPLQPSGALDKYAHFDVTPIIGREYSDLQIKDLLEAPNADELIRDLAITGNPSICLRRWTSA